MNVNSSHNEKLEANFRRGEEEAEDAARVASRMEVVVAILIEVVVVLINIYFIPTVSRFATFLLLDLIDCKNCKPGLGFVDIFYNP